MEKINWKNKIWNYENNLKNYIRQYGNPKSKLHNMSKKELLYLAECTEKAKFLIDEGNLKCIDCTNIIDNCECFRCKKCFCIKCECIIVKKIKKIKLIKKLIYEDKKEINKETNIEILSCKIKLKIFILEMTTKYNNDSLEKDILNLIISVVEKHVILNVVDKTSISNLFKKINKIDKNIQLKILQKIIFYINK